MSHISCHMSHALKAAAETLTSQKSFPPEAGAHLLATHSPEIFTLWPTNTHMLETHVHSLNYGLFSFLTLGRRVVVCTGNTSQRRIRKRKNKGRKTVNRTAMRADGAGMEVWVPGPVPHPHY